jgi:hypothetical protein
MQVRREIDLVKTAFGTTLLEDGPDSLKFEYPRLGVRFDKKLDQWVGGSFIEHPAGFSGGAYALKLFPEIGRIGPDEGGNDHGPKPDNPKMGSGIRAALIENDLVRQFDQKAPRVGLEPIERTRQGPPIRERTSLAKPGNALGESPHDRRHKQFEAVKTRSVARMSPL